MDSQIVNSALTVILNLALPLALGFIVRTFVQAGTAIIAYTRARTDAKLMESFEAFVVQAIKYAEQQLKIGAATPEERKILATQYIKNAVRAVPALSVIVTDEMIQNAIEAFVKEATHVSN